MLLNLKNDIPDVIERAQALDVTEMLVISYDTPSTERMLDLVENIQIFMGHLAVIPKVLLDYDANFESRSREVLAHPKVKALGEIGLDYHCDVPKKSNGKFLNVK